MNNVQRSKSFLDGHRHVKINGSKKEMKKKKLKTVTSVMSMQSKGKSTDGRKEFPCECVNSIDTKSRFNLSLLSVSLVSLATCYVPQF